MITDDFCAAEQDRRRPHGSPYPCGFFAAAHKMAFYVDPAFSGRRVFPLGNSLRLPGSVAKQSLLSPHIRRPASTTLSPSGRRSPRARDAGTAVPDEPSTLFCPRAGARHKNRRTLSIIGRSENVDGRVPKNVSAKQRTLVERPPAGPGWLHQIKFDGIGSSRARTAPACAYGTGTTTDYTGRFCRIRAAVAALPGEGEASIR